MCKLLMALFIRDKIFLHFQEKKLTEENLKLKKLKELSL